ncbi:MAG: hypothetical protein WAM30_06770 [Candidatus Dormiibacterota bacterium]
MPTTHLRQFIAGILVLVAGLGALALRPASTAIPALPDLHAVTASAGLTIEQAYEPSGWGMTFRQWRVRDRLGRESIVYVEATTRPQDVLRWDGVVGYEGQGFLASSPAEAPLPVAGGARGSATAAMLSAPDQLDAVAWTDLGPDGFGAGGLGTAPRLLLDQVRGSPSVWYLVRVTVPSQALGEPTEAQARQVLASVLPALARERASAG